MKRKKLASLRRTYAEKKGARTQGKRAWGYRGDLDAIEPPRNAGFRNNTVQIAQQNDVCPALGFDKEMSMKLRSLDDVCRSAQRVFDLLGTIRGLQIAAKHGSLDEPLPFSWEL